MAKLVKIVVTDDQITVPANTDVGLSSKMGDDFVAQGYGVRTSPGHFRTTSDWLVGKGVPGRETVLWIDEAKKPKSGVRVVPMPRGYMEENPVDAAKRKEFLDREKKENEQRALANEKRKAGR